MAGPSVTNTFANSTTADATQVNQNFTDLINGATDGTKDYSINLLTAAGTATLNGNVVLGSAAAKTITVNGSLSSSIPIGTDGVYDIGSSTLGLRSVYFGANAQRVNIKASASMSATYSLTLPVTAGTSRQQLSTDGTGVTTWQDIRRSPVDLQNYSIATSITASAITVTLNGADGNAPSSTNPVDFVFRNATLATGTPITRTVTTAPTLALATTTSLGLPTAVAAYFYIFALDNAGTVELFASAHPYWDTGKLQTTSTTATSNQVLFGANIRTSMPIRLIGRIKATWTSGVGWSSVTDIALPPFDFQAVVARVFKTASEGFAASATPQQVTMTGVLSGTDALGCYSSSTYTVAAPGKYFIAFHAIYQEIGEGYNLEAEIRVAGASVAQGSTNGTGWGGGAFYPSVSVYTIADLTHEAITFYATQQNASTAARSIQGEVGGTSTYAVIMRIGD